MRKLIICILFFTTLLFADVVIPAGNVSGTWTQANSPYFIDGEITLQLSNNLTIEPGVDVIFNEHYKFIINGKLLAQGTLADSILFTVADTTGFSNFTSTDGSWHGLRFMSCIYNGQGNSILNHCRIEYAKSSGYGAPYADQRGGGIYVNLSSNLEITNCEISNNAAGYGAGIYIYDSSPILSNLTISNNFASSDGGGVLFTGGNTTPTLENSIISENSCSCNGGGIFCSGGSAPILNNTIVNGNSVINGYENGGGGISCWGAYPTLNNVVIINNSSEQCGGGIESRYDSVINISNGIIADNTANSGGGIFNGATLNLSGVTIRENTAEFAGGLYLFGTTVFDPVNRCNIYLNESTQWNGDDFYTVEFMNIDVIVDTFTVLYPNNYFTYPISNFNFDILNCKIEQVYDDLYVSPQGSDDNCGLIAEDPLLTVTHALSIMGTDSLEIHTIHLANGTYSPSSTGETFPIYCISYLAISGANPDSTILDAEGLSNIFSINIADYLIIEDLTIMNGYHVSSGGVYCIESNILFNNVNIISNISDYGGSGIHCYYSIIKMNNVLLANNSNFTTWSNGGAICCQHSDLYLTNITLAQNNAVDNGGGICCLYSSNVVLVNSILHDNEPHDIYLYPTHNTSIMITFSDIEGGEMGIGGSGAINWLENNISADPLFVDPINGDFHLTEDSPCIDAGTAYFEWNGEVILDLDEDEYFGNAPDMGAYESEYITAADIPVSPLIFSLAQNFPNPFNPDTKIQFSIPIDSKVELTVYNLKGQKVKQLVSDQLSAGQHSIVWNGKDENGKQSASGIYFYKVKAEVNGKTKFEKTRKMMLLK